MTHKTIPKHAQDLLFLKTEGSNHLLTCVSVI